MAIDNAEKRRSVSGVGFVPLLPGVTPTAAKDTDWRQQSAWSYSGVAVTGEVPPGTPAVPRTYFGAARVGMMPRR